MLISRGTNALRALNFLKHRNLPPARNSHNWNYRVAPPPASKIKFQIAAAVQGFAWWWILWHLWTEPAHITGEFEYPDPRKWTDEELGVPSD